MISDPSALNSQKLRPSGSIEARTLSDGVRLVKQTARAQYLALTPAQQKIFDRFDGQRMVQDVLRDLLSEGVCSGIRGFYELVLNAMGKGFFFIGEKEPQDEKEEGHRWSVGWGAEVGVAAAVAMVALGSWALGHTKLVLPTGGIEWLGVLVVLVVAFSLGNLLAGCVLSGSGRQVYRPRIRWDRVLPYFSVDGRDAFMGGRICETAVAAQRVAAPFLVAWVVWLLGSPVGIWGSVLAVLMAMSPFGNTPAHELLYALFRQQHQFSRCAATFLQRRLFVQTFKWKEHMTEERYLFLYSTYAIAWLGVVGRLAFRFLEKNIHTLMRNLRQPTGFAGEMFAAVELGILVLAIVVPLAFVVWLLLKGLYRAVAPYWFSAEASLTRAGAQKTRPPVEEVAQFLGKTLLFSQLQPSELKQAAEAMMFTTAEPNTSVMREHDLGNVLCIIYSGEVEILKETDAGESVVVAKLGPGDIFGEIALLDRVPRTSTVRCTRPTSLLVLSRANFEALLVGSLGPEKIKTIVQVCAFLRRNPLFADWHPQALMSVAREFVFQPVATGELVIHEGQANESFFLVYEGRFEVRKKGSACATLGPGDFCGEISLLRHVPATADVVALQPGRCLKLGKDQFLRFVSQNFLTGFLVEDVMEARIGSKEAE
jgi:CRP-like cAMP-binding protein